MSAPAIQSQAHPILLSRTEALDVLRAYLERALSLADPRIDRPEVVAHATLSAWAHHWPSQIDAEVRGLLAATAEIRLREHSRWMTQRRIAIAKIAKSLERTRSAKPYAGL